LDLVGDSIADIAEHFMWGDEDEGGSSGNPNQQPASEGRDQSSSQRRPRSADSGNSGYWKDRLEERFDKMLGIYKHGGARRYDRWQQEGPTEQQRASNRDAASQGRQRGIYQSRRGYDKPPWEEQGNILSTLFGKTVTPDSKALDTFLNRDSSSMLHVMRATGRTSLSLSGYLCRWASVRGALPQSVVVVGVAAAALSGRRPLRAAALALLLFRTFGEVVHGYVYGDNGWIGSDDDDSMYDDEYSYGYEDEYAVPEDSEEVEENRRVDE